MVQSGESWLRERHPEIAKLRALILEANYPSKKLFEKCGYSRHHIVLEKSLK
jgi:RimJ/RimL family protein N-acetyltransferase